jgi:hypothetical protein
MNLSEQLILAQDEHTPEKTLRHIWAVSRSIKVRKAIAKNPNSGPEVLGEASRLYLEEVLENSGFLMLELFSEDPWIKKITQAYSSPEEYLGLSQNFFSRGRADSEKNDQCYWACLLSPQLNAQLLNRVLSRISTTKLRRALKNPKIKEKVKTIYVNALKTKHQELWPFELETLILLCKEEVINYDYFFEGLSNYGVASESCRKGTFTKFISGVFKEYKSSKEDKIICLIAKIFLVCRCHVLYWIPNTHKDGPIELLNWSGELYTKVFKVMLKAKVSKVISKDHIKTIGGIVSSYLQLRFLRERSKDTFDSFGMLEYSQGKLTDVFNYVSLHELNEVHFASLGFTLRKKDSFEALEKCSIEVKEFFVKAGCLGTWVTATNRDCKYKIVNDVNEHIFSTDGISEQLIFKECSLRKIISLDKTLYIL